MDFGMVIDNFLQEEKMINQQQQTKEVNIVQTFESMSADMSYMLSSYRQMLIQYERQIADLIKQNNELTKQLSNKSISSSS